MVTYVHYKLTHDLKYCKSKLLLVVNTGIVIHFKFTLQSIVLFGISVKRLSNIKTVLIIL